MAPTPEGARPEPPAPSCGYCGDPVTVGPDQACGLCAAPHHPACWGEAGRCTTYGCGGVLPVPYRPLVASASVDEASPDALPAPWVPPPRLQAALQDLPASLRASAGGAALALVAYLVLFGARLFTHLPQVALGVGTAAVVYAGISTLVAGVQHRYPGETAVAGGTLFLALFVLGDFEHVAWFRILPMAVLAATSGFVCATATAEAVAGPSTRLGRHLGRAGGVARAALTFVTFAALCLLAALPTTIPVGRALPEILTWALLAAACGSPSMDAARAQERKRLAAAADELEKARVAAQEAPRLSG